MMVHQSSDTSQEVCKFHPERLDQEMDLLSHHLHRRRSLRLLDQLNLFDPGLVLVFYEPRDVVNSEVLIQQLFHEELLVLFNPLPVIIEPV